MQKAKMKSYECSEERRRKKLCTETDFIHKKHMHPIHTYITYNFTTVSYQFLGVNQALWIVKRRNKNTVKEANTRNGKRQSLQ